MEMFADDISDDDSETNLIMAPEKDKSSPLYTEEDDLLDNALDNPKSFI